jgi:hypothetical protein
MRTSSLSRGLWALSLVACGVAPAASTPPRPRISAPPVAHGPSPPIAAPPPEEALVDLLYRTRADVAVSSNVQNPRDYPEHLLDKKLDTAWNGKTGDLEAQIQFRVPASARVRKIEIVVGYAATRGERDLFTMNHRVRQVSLTRDGSPLGTFDLDPEIRTPQAISIDAPGGTFALRVTATVPGSKKEWREVVLSELSVLGTAPEAELLPPAMPQVNVGGLDRTELGRSAVFDEVAKSAPFPSFVALCAKHMLTQEREVARLRRSGSDTFFFDAAGAACAASALRIRTKNLRSPFEEIKFAELLERSRRVVRLVVRTSKGWYPTAHIVTDDYHYNPGCGQRKALVVDSAEVTSGGTLVLRETKHDSYVMGTPHDYEGAGRFMVACVLEGGAPLCREELIASYDGDKSWQWRQEPYEHFLPEPPRWDWTRDATVDDTGRFRLGPCRNMAGADVVCRGANATLMRR